MPASQPRTRHTQLTTESFRELAEESIAELCENSDTLELKDLASWIKDLKRTIGRVSDHQIASDGVGVGEVGRGFAEL